MTAARYVVRLAAVDGDVAHYEIYDRREKAPLPTKPIGREQTEALCERLNERWRRQVAAETETGVTSW